MCGDGAERRKVDKNVENPMPEQMEHGRVEQRSRRRSSATNRRAVRSASGGTKLRFSHHTHNMQLSTLHVR